MAVKHLGMLRFPGSRPASPPGPFPFELDPDLPLRRACAWCGRHQGEDGAWRIPSAAAGTGPAGPLTHVLCGACLGRYFAE